MTALSQATLDHLGASIAVPHYDRSVLLKGIVHIGVGNFHRVHQAVYVDRCLAAGATEWGICGVELIDSPAMRDKAQAYKAQDCLYTVTEFAPDGTSATRVVGSMVDYLHAPADPEAVLARMAHADTRIVSLTITEGGYNIDETSGAFVLATPEVAHDLAGGPPRTAFGFIVEALRRRRAAGIGPFTVMSCDNLRHNGDTARKAIVSFARALDADLAAWIDAEAAFPNSMVDRIAPQVPPEVRARVNAMNGIDDALPAISESFMQWVIEDRFCAGRPAFETVGVELRDDVVAFEFMKGRMLNASHVLLAYPALLCGQRIVHEALAERRFHDLLDAFLDRDVIPRLEAPRGISLTDYKDALLERFANPAVNDQILRLALDGAAKIPVFHSRTIEALLDTGGTLDREAFLVACFGRYLLGRDDAGHEFPVNEPHFGEADWQLLKSGDPLALLHTSLFERLRLFDHADFARLYQAYAEEIEHNSTSAALDRVLAVKG
ncbi:mannitol dehydrogenase family protein [Labrys monachus]|uniref:Mannitol 2-dehydrogenase/sorbose reductase n=1 Tax=Labrys monachus TaxID=217067 RepID=A0ABU0FNA7_9HYPH|nr:mannitol dehydrogenase family protein [Labrys monachus]MDQ0395852.1 mannitol 2-dehydrogenase/sorbose reductase [Labrys monachus]